MARSNLHLQQCSGTDKRISRMLPTCRWAWTRVVRTALQCAAAHASSNRLQAHLVCALPPLCLCAPAPVSLTAMSHGGQAGANVMRWRNSASCPLALTCSLGSVCSRAGFNECDRVECDRPRLQPQSTRLVISKKWSAFNRLPHHGAAKCCARTRATKSAFAGARGHGPVRNGFALA